MAYPYALRGRRSPDHREPGYWRGELSKILIDRGDASENSRTGEIIKKEFWIPMAIMGSKTPFLLRFLSHNGIR